MIKDFWAAVEQEWQMEREAEDEDGDYPWSPPHIIQVLKGELEFLECAVTEGDIEDCQYWARCLSAICKVLDDSVKEWGYRNKVWWLAYEGENFIELYLSDGRKIDIKAEQTGDKWTIYRQENGDKEELETIPRYQIRRALRDYYEAELESF